MAEKCPDCGTEMMDGYLKCPNCGKLKRNVTITDSVSLHDEIEVIKKEVKEIKDKFQWDAVRLGALQIFIGAYLAYYLTYVQNSTNTALLAVISFVVAAILVIIVMGIGRKGVMFLMDVLTLRNWEYKGKV